MQHGIGLSDFGLCGRGEDRYQASIRLSSIDGKKPDCGNEFGR
jgi:hypothetical protein